MQTYLERAVLAAVCCAAATVLCGCGGSSSTTTTVTTTTTNADGSTTTVTTPGSTSGGSTSGASTTYAVGGSVSGLGTDESVTLLNNGGDAVIVSSDGAFVFPTQLAGGSAYAVTVQSHTPGIACSVTEGSGAVGAADVTAIAVSCATGKETTLYSFAGGASGSVPLAGLVLDGSGNLYGTTQQGGSDGHGTVFKLTSGGAETVLHSFGGSGSDGQDPQSSLVMDSAGNLYGTTLRGGAQDAGAIFKVATDGTETVLYSFGVAGTDGQNPGAGLVMDSAGNLYGTTASGGANGDERGDGVVFSLSAAGKETILYSFGATANDGLNPYAGLIRDSAGNLFGTTRAGGAYGSGGPRRGGTVFKLSAAGTETLLHSFGAAGAGEGSSPQAPLAVDSAGNLYGTTASGGSHGDGTVFRID